MSHPRVDARQSHKSNPRIYRGIDVKSQFPLPLTLSMAPTAEPNCSSKNLGRARGVLLLDAENKDGEPASTPIRYPKVGR